MANRCNFLGTITDSCFNDFQVYVLCKTTNERHLLDHKIYTEKQKKPQPTKAKSQGETAEAISASN